MKIKSVYIQNYKILQNFKINFCSNSEVNPITIITGINGSGKTSLLDFIYDVFKKQNITLANGESYIKIEDNDLFENSNFSDNEYILTSEFLKQTRTHFNKKLSDKIIYYKAKKDNENAKKQISDFIDELIYERDIRSSQAYSELRELLNHTLRNLQLEVEFSMLDKNKEIYFRNATSERIKLKELSGGEREIITKIFPLYISNVKNSVILIDEPEGSLHPNWQNEIVNLYMEVAKKNNNQIIIATHSPFIVSAAEKKEYLKILKKEENSIKVIDNSINTFGKKVDEILLEIFRVNGLRTPLIEQKIKKLNHLLLENKYETQEFKSLLKFLENNIGKYDSELAMIRMEIIRKQKLNEKNK